MIDELVRIAELIIFYNVINNTHHVYMGITFTQKISITNTSECLVSNVSVGNFLHNKEHRER